MQGEVNKDLITKGKLDILKIKYLNLLHCLDQRNPPKTYPNQEEKTQLGTQE